MDLKKIVLKNFRAFDHSIIDFNSEVTAIIGNNGSGKTSILDAIAIGMTHLTGELISSNEGYTIDAWFTSKDISNGFKEGSCAITLQSSIINKGQDFSIKVKKIRSERGLTFDKEPENFIKETKEKLKTNEIQSIPVIAYYNVDRTKLENGIHQESIKTYNNLLHAYERSLSLNAPSFKVFEKWFINQVIEENAYKVRLGEIEAELSSMKFIRHIFNDFFSVIEPNTFGSITTINESSLMPDFGTEFNTSLCIEKQGKPMLFQQLSHGERMIIGLVAETARRLFLANQTNPQNGEGIILIDEIELHLHPGWQRKLVPALTKVFPNIQFILTTHSPQVLSNLKEENIRVIENFKLVKEINPVYGEDSNDILWNIFGVKKRPLHAEENFSNFYKLLETDQKKAKEALNELETIYGAEHTEVKKAQMDYEFEFGDYKFSEDETD